MRKTCETKDSDHLRILTSLLLFLDQTDAQSGIRSEGRKDFDLNGDPNWSSHGNKLLHRFKQWNGQGEALDPSSGYHNLVHVAADALYLWSVEKLGKGVDDRPGTRAVQILERMKN